MADDPARMQLVDAELREGEWTSKRVWAGWGTCPRCGHGRIEAEAGARGFCPACGGALLAVL